jgi:hypothetical protein
MVLMMEVVTFRPESRKAGSVSRRIAETLWHFLREGSCNRDHIYEALLALWCICSRVIHAGWCGNGARRSEGPLVGAGWCESAREFLWQSTLRNDSKPEVTNRPGHWRALD